MNPVRDNPHRNNKTFADSIIHSDNDVSNGVEEEKGRIQDEELVRRYCDGEPEALEQLLNRYQRPLFNFIYGIVNEFNRTEDIFQEICLKLIKNINGFVSRGSGSFRRWFYKIALNQSKDLLKSRARSKTMEEKVMTMAQPACRQTRPVVRESTQFDHKADSLRKEIEYLPTEQKEVVLLRIYSGLSFKEIASLLDCPLNTILGRMHYAVNNLRKSLKGDDL